MTVFICYMLPGPQQQCSDFMCEPLIPLPEMTVKMRIYDSFLLVAARLRSGA